jgi:hypothetical protein
MYRSTVPPLTREFALDERTTPMPRADIALTLQISTSVLED